MSGVIASNSDEKGKDDAPPTIMGIQHIHVWPNFASCERYRS